MCSCSFSLTFSPNPSWLLSGCFHRVSRHAGPEQLRRDAVGAAVSRQAEGLAWYRPGLRAAFAAAAVGRLGECNSQSPCLPVLCLTQPHVCKLRWRVWPTACIKGDLETLCSGGTSFPAAKSFLTSECTACEQSEEDDYTFIQQAIQSLSVSTYILG